METSNNLNSLVIARRLIISAQEMDEARRTGKKVDKKTAKELMDEDQAIINGSLPTESIQSSAAPQTNDDLQINLTEVSARLKEVQKQSMEIKTEQFQIDFQQTIEREASLRYTVLERVDGLVRQSQTQAETDRYTFDFSNGTTFKITDKWSNKSTTVWGDPHVDVDDVAGGNDGDFKDLSADNSHTTLMLLDGTRVTFTAKDDGIIEAVDIFKGNQHLRGIGEASEQWGAETGLFSSQVDTGTEKASSLPMGDTVYAGGDGNDWFTSGGQLLWGQTTSPAVTTRPSAVLQLQYSEKITQQIGIQVNTQT